MKVRDKVRVSKDYDQYGNESFAGRIGVIVAGRASESALIKFTKFTGIHGHGANRDEWYIQEKYLTLVRKRKPAKKTKKRKVRRAR